MEDIIKEVIEIKDRLGQVNHKISTVDIRVNGSMEKIKDHILQGDGWRKAIVGLIGVAIFQLISFASLFGMLVANVGHNKECLDKVEHKIDAIIKEQTTVRKENG